MPVPPLYRPVHLQELTEEDADKLAALLERRVGKRFDDIQPEDVTPEVAQEVGAPKLDVS